MIYIDVERIKPDISISATFYSLISVSASAPKSSVVRAVIPI